MTNKVFWDDPYKRRLTTQVVSVMGSVVTLADTIFYAMSGGQASDHGKINGLDVIEAKKSNSDILYTLPVDHGLNEGDLVTVEIDWARRYKLMRLHFAAEVVLEIINRLMAEPTKVGANISPDKARIDIVWPDSVSSYLPAVHTETRKIVDGDFTILSGFSDYATGRRYWQVTGFAKVPCGGTHLKCTGEVGEIKLKRKNIGQGKERIEITLV